MAVRVPLPGGVGVSPARPAGHVVAPVPLPATVTRASTSAGLLTNWWVAHGLAVLTVGLAGVLVWRSCHVRTRPPRWTTYVGNTTLAAGVVVAAMLTGLLYVNAASGFVPNLTALRALFDSGAGTSGSSGGMSAPATVLAAPASGLPSTSAGPGRASGWLRPHVVPGSGSLLRLSIPDPALGVPDGTTYVYLPAGYAQQAAAGARYPVVYLVHGYPGGSSNWMINGAAPQTLDALQAGGYAEPMILVSVDAVGPSHGTDWECLNTAGGPQLETYLTDRVTRFIDARFAAVTGRGGRAIGGMSSGALCALNLGLRHQDLYSVIAAIEPFGDPGKPALRLLGGSKAAWVSNAPRLYLPRLSLHRPLTVYLADGSRSGSLANASRLAAEFARAGINPVLQVIDGGGHEWTTARRALPYALQTASTAMTPPTADAHRPAVRRHHASRL
jgi:S-formylglutathione hydrolase FrmB